MQPVYWEAGVVAGQAVEPYCGPGNCRLPRVNCHMLQTLQLEQNSAPNSADMEQLDRE